MEQDQLNQFVNRYIDVWNERDAVARRAAIADLWAADGATTTPTLEARGYEAIAARVSAAHDRWVAQEGNLFRPRAEADAHHGVVRFRWEMVPATGGPATGAGTNFIVLEDDGRIREDHQFSDPAG